MPLGRRTTTADVYADLRAFSLAFTPEQHFPADEAYTSNLKRVLKVAVENRVLKNSLSVENCQNLGIENVQTTRENRL